MKYIDKFLLLIISILTVGACNQEEFLNAEYYGGIVDENFLTVPSHAGPAVAGVYDVLSYKGTVWNRMNMGSSAADDIVEDHGDANWQNLINLDKYIWLPENGDIWKHWTSQYVGIQRANIVLNRLPSLDDINPDLKKRYLAEVKALRAYYYYNLVTAFGDVPLITTEIGYGDAINLERAPEADVWEQIITDLKEAGADLPDSYDANEDAGRVTRGMTNAMLSRVYLWQKDYSNAANAALAVINSPANYALEADYAALFNGISQYSKEGVFTAMRAANSEKQSIWSDYMDETNYMILWGPFRSWSWFYQPDTNFVRHNNTIEPGDYRIDTITYDVNYECYDLNNDGDCTNDVIYESPPGNIHLMKWVPVNVDLTTGLMWTGGYGNINRYLIRLSEVYLDYAEALVELGQAPQALQYINLVRNRANSTAVTTTDANELRDIILNERKIEFCFEGLRFFDLKRVGRLKEFLGPLGWKDHMVNFPIPQEEIDLTKMTQNPGY